MSASPAVLLLTDHAELGRKVLAETHPDLSVQTCDSFEGMAQALDTSQAEVVYCVRFSSEPGFPREPMLGSPTLRWIAVGGSGTDHLRPWDTSRVTVTNAAGVAADMMAEYTLASMLWFAQDRLVYQAAQRAKAWRPGNMAQIAGRTLLILGLGKTGLAVAQRAKAMGLKTLGVRARPQPTANVDEVHADSELTTVLGRADYVVVCIPLTEATRGLFGAEQFAAMKPGSVLIDLSRGRVVQQSALIAALDAGQLKGAALDVFETEPLPPYSPLWAREDVIITPHCSSVYDGWEEASFRIFADNLGRYRRGEPLMNVVDPVRGY